MKQTIIKVLKELRIALTVWLLFIILNFVICYTMRNEIYVFITKPITSIFNTQYNLLFVYTSIFESFMADMSLSLYSSIMLSFPILLICIYWFLAKSLYQNEKKTLLCMLFLSLLLSTAAALTVYRFLLPHFIQFFMLDVNNASPMLKIGDYVSTFFHLIFIIALIFQFPIILPLLVRFGLIKNNALSKNRKIAILIILIISAIITPPDVFSQIVVALILMIFYELTNCILLRQQKKTHHKKVIHRRCLR